MFTAKNLLRPDYHKSLWRPGEGVLSVALSVGVVCMIAFFFYHSAIAIPFLIPIGVLFFKSREAGCLRRTKQELEIQFRECILSVSTSLRAGYAVENAFLESEKDCLLLFGENAPICRELALIRRGLVSNVTLEELLEDFGMRSGIDSIVQFAQVFSIAKRGGGNISEIVKNSAESIGNAIEMKTEIITLVSGRRMEMTIMKIMPFAILLYIGASSPGYFESLYGNLTGVLVMSGCLVVYLTGVLIGNHMLNKLEDGWR